MILSKNVLDKENDEDNSSSISDSEKREGITELESIMNHIPKSNPI